MLAFALAVLLLGGALWAWQTGGALERRLAHLTASLSEQWGVEVSIGAVSLAGFDRIALHDVRVGGEVPVKADRVVAAFSLFEWLREPAEPLDALRWVRIGDWEVAAPIQFDPAAVSGAGGPAQWLAALGIDIGFRDAERPAGEIGESTAIDLDPAKEIPGPALVWERLLDGVVGREWFDDTLEVYVEGGRVTFAETSADGDGVPSRQGESFVLDVNGTLVFGEGRLQVRNVRVAFGDGDAVVNGSVWPRPDLYVHGTYAQPAAAGGEHGTSALQALESALWVAGSWDELDAWGTAHVRGAVLPWAALAGEEPYTLDEALLKWGYRAGEPLHVTVDGARGAARLRMQGDIYGDGRLALDVAAADVHVPEDLPPLEGHGVLGTLDGTGTVTGTWAEPMLAAEIVSDGGHLFDEPVSGVQGRVRLTPSEFAFDAVRVTQERASYFLEGSLGFSEPRPFDVLLRTDDGRAETLLSVLGWDVPVQAGLAGTIRFSGPSGEVHAEGELTLERGHAWGQPFDRLDGDFRYADGAFRVTDVAGSVRGGTVIASGGSVSFGQPDRAGNDWSLDVTAEDVPLQAIAAWRQQLPGVSGLVDFSGTVRSVSDESAWPPRVAGAVQARHVSVGSLDFTSAEGAVAWEDDVLASDGLHLHRRNGGTYAVKGQIVDVFTDARLELEVDVEDESIGSLLALTDWRLPLLAHSEAARARATVEGTPEAPEAHIELEADAVYVGGRPTPLALGLRWRDGRIEVENGFLRQGKYDSAGT